MVSEDPHVKLRQLAEKQMKSCLHAQFLEECLTENVIPKGLQLKLKVNTGSDSGELQNSIDGLLRRVSAEICEQVRDEHLRKSETYGKEMEQIRNELMKSMDPQELFSTDEKISQLTEEKKEVLKQGHKKKLNYLKGKDSANNIEPNVSKTLNKKRPYIQKQRVVNKKTPEKAMPNKDEAGNHSKNLETPGTTLTYAEALKKGEKQVEKNLQTSVENLTNIMTQFISIMMDTKKVETEDSYEWKTPKYGAKQRKGLNRYRKAKRQC